MKTIKENELSEVDALKAKVRMLEDAINGWRKVSAEDAAKLKEMTRFRDNLFRANNEELERTRAARRENERLSAILDALTTDVVLKGKLIEAMTLKVERGKGWLEAGWKAANLRPGDPGRDGIKKGYKMVVEAYEERGSYERQIRSD